MYLIGILLRVPAAFHTGGAGPQGSCPYACARFSISLLQTSTTKNQIGNSLASRNARGRHRALNAGDVAHRFSRGCAHCLSCLSPEREIGPLLEADEASEGPSPEHFLRVTEPRAKY